MEEYFCMECKFFGGYDVLGNALCYKDDTNPRIVSPYEVHNEMDECLNGKYKSGYTLLSKKYIANELNKVHEFGTIFTLDERKAIAVSKATWERKNPIGEAYDVVSYWDDCDRKVVNPKPLLYSEACKLCEKYLSTRPSGSLYYYAVEVHK